MRKGKEMEKTTDFETTEKLAGRKKRGSIKEMEKDLDL